MNELGLEQAALSRAVGVSRQVVVYWCAPVTNRLVRRPAYTKAPLLAGILCVPESDLRRRLGAAKIALEEFRRGLHTPQPAQVPA
jgi:hypothetical protein